MARCERSSPIQHLLNSALCLALSARAERCGCWRSAGTALPQRAGAKGGASEQRCSRACRPYAPARLLRHPQQHPQRRCAALGAAADAPRPRRCQVVFMGMGEPLGNYHNGPARPPRPHGAARPRPRPLRAEGRFHVDAPRRLTPDALRTVLAAVRRINTEVGIGARHITISTVRSRRARAPAQSPGRGPPCWPRVEARAGTGRARTAHSAARERGNPGAVLSRGGSQSKLYIHIYNRLGSEADLVESLSATNPCKVSEKQIRVKFPRSSSQRGGSR